MRYQIPAILLYPYSFDVDLYSHESTRALGIPVPEVITQISIKSKAAGGHYDLVKSRGHLLKEGKQDVIRNGAIILGFKQLVLYEFLDDKEFGYPNTIATEDVAGVIAAIIKVYYKKQEFNPHLNIYLMGAAYPNEDPLLPWSSLVKYVTLVF